MTGCAHLEFAARVEVNRLEDLDPMGFTADIRIQCEACGLAMMFVGDLPLGLAANGPALSPDGTELRIPLRPFDQDRTPLAMAGFTIRSHPPRRSDA